MSGGTLISLCFLALAAFCIVTAVIALVTAKYDTQGNITEWNSPVGKVKSSSLPFLILLVGLSFGFFGFQLQPPAQVDTVEFDASVVVDPELINEVHSVVVGITTSPWSQTSTPDSSNGEIKVKIPVPAGWQSYIGYAFAHGSAQTRPTVRGLSKDNPKFEIRLAKDGN